MSKTLLSPHWIPHHRDGSDRDTLAWWQPPVVKIVCNDETVPYLEDVPPGAGLIVRHYPSSDDPRRGFVRGAAVLRTPAPDAVTPVTAADYYGRSGSDRDDIPFAAIRAAMVPSADAWTPEQAAAEHAAIAGRMADYLRARGWDLRRVWFEGINEPRLWADEPPELIARYERARLIALHKLGLQGMVLNAGVGWPGNGGVANAPVQWDWFKPVIDVWGNGDRLGLHEYWYLHGPEENWTWWAGRYRQCPYRVPIAITECGIDCGVVAGQAGSGWARLPEPEMRAKASRYIAELQRYEDAALADGRIEAVCVFTYDGVKEHWGGFNIRCDDWLSEFRAWLAGRAEIVRRPVEEPKDPDLPPVIAPATFAPFLAWPLHRTYAITQRFGEQRLDYSRYGLIAHNGLDLVAPRGTPVFAMHAGQAWVYDDPGGYGRTVEVWAPSRARAAAYKTIYAHLDAFHVADGQRVAAGQLLGVLGNTGNSTGPHLHTGLKWLMRGGVYARNPGYRDWVDPWPFLKGA